MHFVKVVLIPRANSILDAPSHPHHPSQPLSAACPPTQPAACTPTPIPNTFVPPCAHHYWVSLKPAPSNITAYQSGWKTNNVDGAVSWATILTRLVSPRKHLHRQSARCQLSTPPTKQPSHTYHHPNRPWPKYAASSTPGTLSACCRTTSQSAWPTPPIVTLYH